MDVLWNPTAGAPRRAPIDVSTIVDTAVGILDREGPAGLSMRALAAHLDVVPSALYWHVPDKQTLLALVADHALADVLQPDDEDADWKDRIRALVARYRIAIAKHPGVIPLMATGVRLGPNNLRIVDRLLAILRNAGFSDDDASAAFEGIGYIARGFLEGREDGPDGRSAALRDRWLGGRSLADLEPHSFPTIVAMADVLLSTDAEERFAFVLDALLDGFDRRRPTATSPARDSE